MLVRIGVAAKIIGACTKTLRRWEQQGRLLPAYRTPGNHRRYNTADLQVFISGCTREEHGSRITKKTGVKESFTRVKWSSVPQRVVCYARVSSTKQRRDLDRQVKGLVDYCSQQGYQVAAVYKDIASGLNDRRTGLFRLLDAVVAGWVDRVVVTYPDRLARFGTRFIERVFTDHGTVLETTRSSFPGSINEASTSSDSDDPYRVLVDDMVALVTSFAGKLHRLRRGKRQGSITSSKNDLGRKNACTPAITSFPVVIPPPG